MPDTTAKEARRTESPEPRGVLTVRVPKAERARPHRIEVKSEG